MNFTNKICVITGAANGIGRCITEVLLSEGANVAAIDVDDQGTAQLRTRYSEDRLLFVRGDIAEEQVLADFAQCVLEKFGHIDYLVNNACISKKGILSHCSYDDFNYVLKVGITAPYMLSMIFATHFLPGAVIVNISSTRASTSQPDTESYTAAKGGISALTHALSISLAGKVRVNSISPGWIDTGAYQSDEHYLPSHAEADKAQHPVGRIGEPADIANMVLFLCSDAATFITGENITIDGGMSKQMIYHDDHGWTYRQEKQL